MLTPDGSLDSEPVGENKSANDAKTASTEQTGNANQNISPSGGVPSPPPSVTHHHVTYKPEKDWWDKGKPFIEIAGVLLLLIYTVYTIKMYWANKEAATAATSAAKTATDALAQSKIDNASQEAINKAARKEAADQSRAALQASIDASRTDQRAWLRMSAKAATLDLGQIIYAPMELVNSGKTPAIDVNGYLFFHLLPRSQVPNFSRVPDESPNHKPDWHGGIVVHTMFPTRDDESTKGDTQSFAVTDPTVTQPIDAKTAIFVIATKDVIDDLIDPTDNGKHWIAVYGRVTYRDVFSKEHWLTVCWDALKTNYAERNVTLACGEHNESDWTCPHF